MVKVRLGKDKQQHTALMFIGTLGLALISKRLWFAVCVAFAIGILKELYDSTVGTTGYSMADMAANALGISVAMVIFIIFFPNIDAEE